MKCHIYNGVTQIIVDATPTCGDYCDTCGDCLDCYGSDPCPHSEDGEHFWVVDDTLS